MPLHANTAHYSSYSTSQHTHTLVLEQVTYVHNRHSNPWLAIHVAYTVEPLNNVTFGTSYSVHYREVAFFGGYKCVSTIYRKVTFWCSKSCLLFRLPLFGVSFNGGSTVLVSLR